MPRKVDYLVLELITKLRLLLSSTTLITVKLQHLEAEGVGEMFISFFNRPKVKVSDTSRFIKDSV